jgi:ABC-type multidrug transport system ATPase subunit
MANNATPPPSPAYFKSLTVKNVKCFKGEQTIDLSDGNGKPAQWTVILGDNNTGKTTLLRCLASLEPKLLVINNVFASPTDIFRKFINPGENSSEKKISHEENLSIRCHLLIKESGTWKFKDGFWDEKRAELIIYGYGTARRMDTSSLSEKDNKYATSSLFYDDITLINAEEWLLQTDYAVKNGVNAAASRLAKIKQVLTSGILPDVTDFSFTTTKDLKSFVEFKTDYGSFRLNERLFDRYPGSENPLAEPAIVLVDEIDLHLHPEWQRKIIQFLTAQFPSTQFIVSSHSPLIVQSADNLNLVLLEKESDHVTIRRPNLTTYQGWTIEEILNELMDLGEKTLSDNYLALIKQFDEALDKEDYAKTKAAYDELDKILHPESSQRKLLRIQMSSLMPETV